MPDTHRTEQTSVNVCPRCKRPMTFVKSIPELAPSLPELHILTCAECGEVEIKEVERAA